MTTDYLQDFIDIHNFDAGTTISPDSIYIKPQSAFIFETYITSKISFQVLTGKPYYTKAFSPLNNKDALRVAINGENVVLFATNDYPLFSFDATITFKNSEVIEYSRAVCTTTGIDQENITSSSDFSIYDIRYILMSDSNFLVALTKLGFYGPFALPDSCLSMSASALLNLVERKEYKLRVRLNDKTFCTQVFDGNNPYGSGNHISILPSNLYKISGLDIWINETISVC